MSNYRINEYHAVSPDHPESADGRCYLRVSKNTMTPEGMIRRTPVLEVLGVCAVDACTIGVDRGWGGDMYAARTAIRGFYGTHTEINPLADRTRDVFTGEVVEQIVAAQMSGELPFPELNSSLAPADVAVTSEAIV